MARGTLSAPKESRRRTNKPAHEEIILPRDEILRGPDLADLTGRADWPVAVTIWYATWRRSPQAAAFEDTDWMRLGMLAPIIEGYFKRPGAAALGEIRMTEERLGATVVDRMRARMKIEARPDAEGEDAPVLSIVKDEDILDRL